MANNTQFCEDLQGQMISACRLLRKVESTYNPSENLSIEEELSILSCAGHLIEAVHYSFLVRGDCSIHMEKLNDTVNSMGTTRDYIARGYQEDE